MVHALYAVLGPRDVDRPPGRMSRYARGRVHGAWAGARGTLDGPAPGRAGPGAAAPRPAAEHGRVARPLYASNHAVTRALYSHTRTGQWLDTTRHDTKIAN
jgi:hypothetical protein